MSNDNVVYILGAGFSRMFGIPVMESFLDQARELFRSDRTRFAYFQQIFTAIRQLAVASTFYKINTNNIEDVFSWIEMERFVGASHVDNKYDQFICDVVRNSRKNIEPYVGTFPGNWETFVFGNSKKWNTCGAFLMSLFNASVRKSQDGHSLHFSRMPDPKTSYSIITLNYDDVLESLITSLSKRCTITDDIRFVASESEQIGGIPYVKLHGSILGDEILPPSWNKGFRNKGFKESWHLAYSLISQANHIRVIGYSLPESDSYIKYLLNTAVLRSEHLKSIDVLCLDREGIVEKRYRDFIVFPKFRFFNDRTEKYLERNWNLVCAPVARGLHPDVRFDKLEIAHSELNSVADQSA